eukprot:s287_g39.t1
MASARAFAPSSLMLLALKSMLVVELLTFKASAKAWRKRHPDQGWRLRSTTLTGQSLSSLKRPDERLPIKGW